MFFLMSSSSRVLTSDENYSEFQMIQEEYKNEHVRIKLGIKLKRVRAFGRIHRLYVKAVDTLIRPDVSYADCSK